MPNTSRSSSSAANAARYLDDSDVGDDEGVDADEINTSQFRDAPQPSQQQHRYNFKPRKPREYGTHDIFTPETYVLRARKGPVIETQVDSEAEEDAEPHFGRRRRQAVAKRKEGGNGKRGKGRA